LILPFAWLELAAGRRRLRGVRAARATASTSCSGRRLVVEAGEGGRLERAEFNRDWVRVEPGADDRSLIEVSGRAGG
jgi:hypothetical protein